MMNELRADEAVAAGGGVGRPVHRLVPVERAAMSFTVCVIDTMHGRPADGVAVRVERRVDGEWRGLVQGVTDETGGLAGVLSKLPVTCGVYRVELDVDGYFASLGIAAFHPVVSVVFRVGEPTGYHIPILITPHSLQTYRSA